MIQKLYSIMAKKTAMSRTVTDRLRVLPVAALTPGPRLYLPALPVLLGQHRYAPEHGAFVMLVAKTTHASTESDPA